MNHDLDGPSSSGRHAGCPGSRELERRAIELNLEALEDQEDAESGTRLHAAIALKEPLPEGHPDWWIVDRCWKYKADKLPGAGPHDTPWIETEITLPIYRGMQELTHGTLDLLYLAPRKIVVIDWKTGREEPDEEILEWQMKLYAQAAIQKWYQVAKDKEWLYERKEDGEYGWINYPPAEVYVYFPRLGLERTGVYAYGHQIAAEYASAIEYAKSHPDHYRPSVGRCKYCKGKSLCPAFKAEFVTALEAPPKKQNFAALPLEKVVEIVEIWGPKVNLASRLVEGARKHLRDNVPADMLAGIGYEVVESTRNGYSVNPTTVRKLVKKGTGNESVPTATE